MYCPNCGRQISEGEKNCIYCTTTYTAKEPQESVLNNTAKVLIVAMVFIIPFLGYLIGAVIGAVFMGKQNSDYKSFGKVLFILCIVLIIVSLMCCFMAVVFDAAFASLISQMYE